MNIKIRSTNFDITQAINDYIHKKLSLLEKFLPANEQTLCEIEIGRTTLHHKSGDIFRAEVNITQPGRKQVYAVTEESDLYSAIDIVRDEAERVIISQKEKHNTLFRRGAVRVKELMKRINIRRKP